MSMKSKKSKTNQASVMSKMSINLIDKHDK
jgi:hypothetical protein